MAPASQSTHCYLVCVTCMSQDLAGVLKVVFCGSRWVWVGVGESHDNRLAGSLKIQQMLFLLIQTLQAFFVTRIYQVTRFLESQISKFDVASQRWPRPQSWCDSNNQNYTARFMHACMNICETYACIYTGVAPSRKNMLIATGVK